MLGKKNKRKVLREVMTTSLPAMWRFGLSLSGRPDVADDLVQATCLRAMERVDQIKDGGRVDAWLMTILRSIWLNELRSATIRKAQSLSQTPDYELICEKPTAEVNIFASEVFTEVMGLPEAQREAVLLVFVEGYSYRAAAGILDVPIGTIMSRLSAARVKLKARMVDAPRAGKVSEE